MEIKRTTIIKEGDAHTTNARYECEYTIIGEDLMKLSATVYRKREENIIDTEGNPSAQTVEEQMGNITLRAGRIDITDFMYSDKIGLYMQEFAAIVQGILSPVG